MKNKNLRKLLLKSATLKEWKGEGKKPAIYRGKKAGDTIESSDETLSILAEMGIVDYKPTKKAVK